MEDVFLLLSTDDVNKSKTMKLGRTVKLKFEKESKCVCIVFRHRGRSTTHLRVLKHMKNSEHICSNAASLTTA